MAAILDMRKYPPHCPRPSTNSPIHPRADSTLQPAAAAAPPSPRSTIQRPSLTELPLCLPACQPARHPRVLSKSGPTPFCKRTGSLLSHFIDSPNFLLFVHIFTVEQYDRLPYFPKIFSGKSLRKNGRRNLEIINFFRNIK